jgi:hypothetical protein
MAQITIKHQPLSRFLSFCCNNIIFIKDFIFYTLKYSKLVQNWYEEVVVKSGVHAAAD